MRKYVFPIVFLLASLVIYGQEIEVTFTGAGLYTSVDTVQAKNLTTNDSIILPGDHTLYLNLVTSVEENPIQDTDIQLYPNPFDNSTTLRFYHESPEKTIISVYNIAGKRVSILNVELTAGWHSFDISFGSRGLYFVDVKSVSSHKTIKAICLEAEGGSDDIEYTGETEAEFLNPLENFKTGTQSYTLGYSDGDILAFRCKHGKHTTIITDSPGESVNYEIEFVNCTDPANKTYEIVKIGDQMWMAENMAYASGSSSGNILQNGKYGVLYNWESTVCPSGWHLPSDDEWEMMEQNFGWDVGWNLRTSYGWDEGYNGDNESQFSALPGGWYGTEGMERIGSNAYFWSSTEIDDHSVWIRVLNSYSRRNFLPKWQRTYALKGVKMSVRCIYNEPDINVKAVFDIKENSAILEANILYYNDESEITKRGVCWSTEENPGISDNFSFTQGSLGQFFIELNDLETNTVYFARAFFEGLGGEVFYSDQVTFRSAAGSFMDNRDGNVYGYQKVVSQNWMVDNLAYLPKVDGTDRRYNTPYHYVYDYDGYNVDEAKQLPEYAKYGVLYNHLAALESCPENWYLPSDSDWKVLERNLGMDEDEIGLTASRNSGEIGRKLKASVSWFDNGNGNNSSGLNFLASGGLDEQYEYWPFLNEGTDSYYWSSSAEKPNYAYFRSLSSVFSGVVRYSFPIGFGFSVRCFQYTGADPVIETADILRVTDSEAYGGGRIIYEGNETITSGGLCWSTDENPTIDDQHSTDIIESGYFDTHISGLLPGTIYNVRAYVIWDSGTTYGNQESFRTSEGSFIDHRDSSLYTYIEIGNQVWMANNLAYMPFTGDSVSVEHGDASYWVYGYDGSNVNSAKMMDEYLNYGTLYNWKAAKLACPAGWHLPSDEEWGELELFLGMHISEIETVGSRFSGQVGLKLKSLTGWGGAGDNSSRFNALRAGYRNYNGSYSKGQAGFWTASSDGSSNAWYRGLEYEYSIDGVRRFFEPKNNGYSVRCLKD